MSDAATADITNNIIVANTTGTATCQDVSVDSDGDGNDTHASVVFQNNDINLIDGFCVSDVDFTVDPSNIYADPQFVDAENGDFHLALTSPVINMGNKTHPMLPATDIEGTARVIGASVDIGADEVKFLRAPVLKSPSGAITTNSPDYSWQQVADATHYRLSVTDSNGAVVRAQTFSAANICGDGTCSVPTGTPLEAEKKYSWTVRAINTESNLGTGLWAVKKDFFVTFIAPVGQPVLIAPKGTIEGVSPSFTWTAVDGATSYRLAVRNSGAVVFAKWFNASAICSGGTCTTPGVPLDAGKKYYWTVAGINVFGTGPYSVMSNFTITASPE
jgi:hypothetical protein